MRQVTATQITSVNQNSDQPVEEYHSSKHDRLFQNPSSTFSISSNKTVTHRNESLSPSKSNGSFNSTMDYTQHNKTQPPGDNTDQGEGKATSILNVPISRKSRFDKHFKGNSSSRHAPDPHTKSSTQNTGRMLDSSQKFSTSVVEQYFQSLSDLSQTCSNSSNVKTNLSNFHVDMGSEQKFDGDNRVPVSAVQSEAPDSTISCREKTDNSHPKLPIDSTQAGVGTIITNNFLSSAVSSKEPINKKASEFVFKLRGNFQSSFLSNELKLWDLSKVEENGFGSCEAIRTIDNILKHYGISNTVPPPSSRVNDAAGSKEIFDEYGENRNISQNNETLPDSSETNIQETNNIQTSSQPTEVVSTTVASSTKNVNTPAPNDPNMSSLAYTNNKSLPTSGLGFKTNISQNNETSSKYNTGGNDMVRKYGSSVDYTVTGVAGKYSVTSKVNYGRYDYGKSKMLSGDNPASSTITYPTKESKTNESIKNKIRTLDQQSEGSEVDVSRDTGYDQIRSMGSATDALEFSITSERQRLRKLDALITATSRTTPAAGVPGSYAARYVSPERDYGRYKTHDPITRIMSSPTFPTSSYMTTAHKSSWAGSVGHHDTSALLGKSASVPGNWGLSFPSSRYLVPNDMRSAYSPYLYNRDYNLQYNNSTYNSELAEKFAGLNNSNKNHKKPLPNKKQECPLRNRNKNTSPTTLRNHNISQCPFAHASNAAYFNNPRRDTECKSKIGSKKTTVPAKKNAKTNINESKSTYSTYNGLEFPKDHNKMWQEPMFRKVSSSKPTQNVSKYSPHKPNTSRQPRKEETFLGIAQELFRKSGAQLSARTSLSSRKVSSANAPTGRFLGYDSDSTFISSRSVRDGRNVHEIYNRSNNPLEKNKSKLEPSVYLYQAASMPKSILTQFTNKIACTNFGTTSSRSGYSRFF